MRRGSVGLFDDAVNISEDPSDVVGNDSDVNGHDLAATASPSESVKTIVDLEHLIEEEEESLRDAGVHQVQGDLLLLGVSLPY